MKKILLLTVFCICISFLTGSATEPELDNFDGRYTGARAWWDSSAVYDRDMTNSNSHLGAYSLQVVYNKDAGGIWDYFGYDAGSGFDFSAYTHFGFYIYSVLNSSQIQFNILDDDGDEMRYTAQTVNQGAGWQLMNWQFSDGVFVANGDGSFEWDTVRRILFFVWGGNGVATGIFRMDDIQFYKSSLSAPVIDAITDIYGIGDYDVTWSSVTGAALYEIWEDDSYKFADGCSDAGSGWDKSTPTVTSNSYSHKSDDGKTYYYMIRAWSDAEASGGACSLWSSVKNLLVSVLGPPALDNISDTDDDGVYDIEWSNPNGAALFELMESSKADFTGDTETYWPATTSQEIDHKNADSSVRYYYKVRAWSDTPANGGKCTEWSGVKSFSIEFEVFDDVEIDAVSPDSMFAGEEGEIVIKGSGFTEDCVVSFSGAGIDVDSVDYRSENKLIVDVSIESGAAAGARDITVRTAGGSDKAGDIFSVLPAIGESEVKITGGEEGWVNPLDGEESRIIFRTPKSGKVNIYLYTASGRLVWEKKLDAVSGAYCDVGWACRNMSDEMVSSGIYIVHISGAGMDAVKKIAVVK
ncbi:MAG: hypothetical protein JXJ19_06325 [Elusimicrobia bacterium]|nr:hypothetical protein [Elusimicrobiota bacterium]